MGERMYVAEIIAATDLDPGVVHRVHGTPEVPSDPAEPVDSYGRHLLLPSHR
jgi:hypothetical protein